MRRNSCSAHHRDRRPVDRGLGVPGAAGRRTSAADRTSHGIEKVKDNLYMITGGGGNTAVFITDGGVVIVDTKLAGWGQAILDTSSTVTTSRSR